MALLAETVNETLEFKWEAFYYNPAVNENALTDYKLAFSGYGLSLKLFMQVNHILDSWRYLYLIIE